MAPTVLKKRGNKTFMSRHLKTPQLPDPFENIPIQYGIKKCSNKFDWKRFSWKEQWEVTEGLPNFRIYGNKYYLFETEEQANEFMMLKMMEQ